MAARLALIVPVAAACGRDQPSATAPSASAPLASAPSASAPPASAPAPGPPPLASKAFYRLDAAPLAPCAPGATCEVKLVLTALGDYHINKEYPFKFIGEPPPALPLDGEPSFAHDSDQRATLTLRVKPTAAGPTTLAGVFKLSVCSDDTCEIEKPKIELAVAVR